MALRINNMRVYSYHGALPQENRVGNSFVLNITLELNDTSAAQTDDLALAANYAEVISLVKEQMGIQTKLLETLACRIAKKILEAFPIVERVQLTIEKDKPPVPGNVASAAVSITAKR